VTNPKALNGLGINVSTTGPYLEKYW
jgi:hypothetical protein